MDDLRRTYVFSGHVQGVGFRMTSHRIAENYPIRGYVRNLDDGRVELVVEGEPATLDAYEAALSARMGGYIDRTQRKDEPAAGGFDGFRIRF